MVVHNSDFEKQINPFTSEYPNFHKKTVNEESYLKGILDIPNDEGTVAGSFLVEIHPSKGFPYAFPILYEVGGEIPCGADWHKYQDNSCCLTVPAEEKLMCKNGITLVWFVQNIAIPYLAHQLYKKHTGHYLQEYSHDIGGIREFYEKFFPLSERNIWKQSLEHVFGNSKAERNSICYCNSGKKYKKCHLPIENNIRAIGKEQVFYDFKVLGLI